MTLATAFRYLRRTRELGFWGTLRRLGTRSADPVIRWTRSGWWGWKARRGMSDAALLARTTGAWSSIEALLEHLAARPGASFMLPHNSPQEAAEALERRYPGYLFELVAAADAASRNELHLAGREFRFPGRIDWLTDPVSGWRWPLVHRSRIGTYLRAESAADPLFTWELNRHQHFALMGLAFWLSNDERYVDAFNTQLLSWIETNPVQHGINWCDSLEIAIRLVSWTVAFQFFRGSPNFREKAGKVFLKSLWQQADFLSNHLQSTTSPGVVPNNHIIGELTGLTLVGAAFPEFRRARAWRKEALRLLNQEVVAQTHGDGVNKEQATLYHRFVLELLLLIVARSRQRALPAVPALEHTLEGMLDYVCGIMTPSGAVPMWGDSASIRAFGLGQTKDFWDFRPILSAGAALFGHPDWKYVAGRFAEEALLLLGIAGLNRWEQLKAQPPKAASRSFPEGGMYVIRDAWAADADVGFLRCGPWGLGGEGHCAHAHSDLLSFLLYARGEPVLVDSGTYSYFGPWRNRFRLTPAHNTVMIDGRNQAIPLRNFGWKHIPEARCTEWSGERVRGVLTDSGNVAFSRELWHPQQGVWYVVDTFSGRGEHRLEWFFHFAPGLDLNLDEEHQRITVLKAGQLVLAVQIPERGIRPEVRDSWYSHQYGRKQANRELYALWHGELGTIGVSFRWQFQVPRGEFPGSRKLVPNGEI